MLASTLYKEFVIIKIKVKLKCSDLNIVVSKYKIIPQWTNSLTAFL